MIELFQIKGAHQAQREQMLNSGTKTAYNQYKTTLG